MYIYIAEVGFWGLTAQALTQTRIERNSQYLSTKKYGLDTPEGLQRREEKMNWSNWK